MSRNLTVQLTIAGLLVLVLIAAIIQIVQYNSIETDLIEVRQKTERNEELLSQLDKKLEGGIRVSNAGGGSGNTATNDGGGDDGLLDTSIEGNILEVDPVPFVDPKAKRGGTLKIARGSDYKGFNKLAENGAGVQELYDGLVGDRIARRHYDDPEKWHPMLAKAVRVENDNKTYHVWLRQGVKWHKPAVDFANDRYKWLDKEHEVTSDDFKFMVEMLQNPQVEGAAPLRTYFADFDRIEILGPYEFKLHWKKKYALSKGISLDSIYPLPRWLYSYDEDGNEYPAETLGLKFNSHWYNDRGIGSGPFRFVESKPGQYVRLERNEGYYQGAPPLKEIVIKIVKDDNQRLLQLKKGDLDFIGLTPTQYRKEILEAPDSPFNKGQFKWDTYTRLVYYYLGWNGDAVFFTDKRVRQAMTYAFNREKILKEVFMDLGVIISGNFHIWTPWYNKDVTPRPFDLEKASALLEEAGWKDTDGDGVRDKVVKGAKRDFEITFLIYNNSPEYKTMADIFKEDLIKIGVKMKILPVDWPTMQKKMDDKEFDGFTGGWGMDWDSDPYQLWHSSQADIPKGSNRVAFRNEEADKIIMEARSTFDFEKRQKLFNRFHEIMYEEQAYTFFRTPKAVIAWNPRVQNIKVQKVRPQTLYALMWVNDGK